MAVTSVVPEGEVSARLFGSVESFISPFDQLVGHFIFQALSGTDADGYVQTLPLMR